MLHCGGANVVTTIFFFLKEEENIVMIFFGSNFSDRIRKLTNVYHVLILKVGIA
jgi:hypothetical protein